MRGDKDAQDFAEALIQGVLDNMEMIDELVSQCSTNWKITRMAIVDRNILRMAAYELQHLKDIPPRVSLNEAVELAKKYGTKDSSAFVNGILDRIASMVPDPS